MGTNLGALGVLGVATRRNITGFTGIDDPYEPPEQADIVLNTVKHSAEANARLIQDYLSEQGFVRRDDWAQVKGDGGRLAVEDISQPVSDGSLK